MHTLDIYLSVDKRRDQILSAHIARVFRPFLRYPAQVYCVCGSGARGPAAGTAGGFSFGIGEGIGDVIQVAAAAGG